MTTLATLQAHLKDQSAASSFTFNEDISTFAKTYFRNAQSSHTLASLAQTLGTTTTVFTVLGAPLAYFSVGQKYPFVQKLYEKYTARNIAILLLASSVILIAGLCLWSHIENKTLDVLRDTLEQNDPSAIINAYENSGISPSSLMREAAKKDNKTGIALAMLLIEQEQERHAAAQDAYPFAKQAAGEYLTTSCSLEHSYIAKNTTVELTKINPNLFETLKNSVQGKFDSGTHELASRHFQKANTANKNRTLCRYATTGIVSITGIVAVLAYCEVFQKYVTFAQTRNIAVACAILCIASAIILRRLITYENHLASQLLSACEGDSKLEAMLNKNYHKVKDNLPATIDDAIEAYGKGMTDKDRNILRKVFEQNDQLLAHPYKQQANRNNIYETFAAQKIIASMNAKGLDPKASASKKAHLLAKIANTENKIATNAMLALLSEKERKEVIGQALIETEKFAFLKQYCDINEFNADLFEKSNEQILNHIKAGSLQKIETMGSRYIYLSKLNSELTTLANWNDAPEHLRKPLPMDKIIQALYNNHTLTIAAKLRVAEACGLPDYQDLYNTIKQHCQNSEFNEDEAQQLQDLEITDKKNNDKQRFLDRKQFIENSSLSRKAKLQMIEECALLKHKSAAQIYTSYKDKNAAFRMSKSSAKIVASWC